MRRREIELKQDIKDAIKSQAKGVLGILIKLIIDKLVQAVLNALRDKSWIGDDVQPEDPYDGNPV